MGLAVDLDGQLEQRLLFLREAERRDVEAADGVDLLVGDATKAKATLGWEPKVSFNELVTMMVEYDIQLERSKLS